MSVIAIVLGLGLFGIIVGVAYWFAREEQKTIKRVPPEEMDDAGQGRGPAYLCCTYSPVGLASRERSI
jgi:hypothetical protein